ncbi:MAG: hypothetical protein KIT57_00390 [Blastocatellales bacterium]|nr:hypothetical protein [Blastocatellales bacterium]
MSFKIVSKQSYRANADNHHGNHQQNSRENKQAKSDGSIDPGQIPDLAAFEILLKMMSSPDLGKLSPGTRRAYSEAAGFSDEEDAAIINAGYEYREKIKGLDEQAEHVKSAKWPEPSRQDMDHLAVLQNAKEGILADTVQQLQSRLTSTGRSNLSTHIQDKVKRHTKGFLTELPSKRIGFLNKLTDAFTASAQAPGCDTQVYVYSDTFPNYSYMNISAWGDYSMPYNNCAHTISLSYEMWGPNSTYSSGAFGASINLEQPGGLNLDGYFASNTTAEFYCAIAAQSGVAGIIGSFFQQPPWIKPNNVVVNNSDNIQHNPHYYNSSADSFVRFRYGISYNANSSHTFLVSPGVETGGSLAPANITPSSGGAKNVDRDKGYVEIKYTLSAHTVGTYIPQMQFSKSSTSTLVILPTTPQFAAVPTASPVYANQAIP